MFKFKQTALQAFPKQNGEPSASVCLVLTSASELSGITGSFPFSTLQILMLSVFDRAQRRSISISACEHKCTDTETPFFFLFLLHNFKVIVCEHDEKETGT